MTNINNTNNFDNSRLQNFALGATGAVVGFEAEPIIKRYINKPVTKKVIKNIRTIQNGNFKSYIEKALDQNNLRDSLKILDLNAQTKNDVLKYLQDLNSNDAKPNFIKKILNKFLRRGFKVKNPIPATLQGFQAFCIPSKNTVVCNLDKFGAPIFHEIAHKLNYQSKNIIVNTLSKIRNPLATWGALCVSVIALLKDAKGKRSEPKNGFQKATNFVKDNCGLCATATMLPLTIEEIIANIKGTKIAKKAGVTGDLLNKVKKCHKTSIISYSVTAIITGLSVFLASKLRDLICSKKVNNAN